jgi:hypothetical protein
MKQPAKTVQRIWFKAQLTPMAAGLFTEAFYPPAKRGTGAQYVFFTQIDITPTVHKVVVASRMAESGIRLMTQELAYKCLIPSEKATKAEMAQLNELSTNLKV